jgi:hypothetical protein
VRPSTSKSCEIGESPHLNALKRTIYSAIDSNADALRRSLGAEGGAVVRARANVTVGNGKVLGYRVSTSCSTIGEGQKCASRTLDSTGVLGDIGIKGSSFPVPGEPCQISLSRTVSQSR